MLIGLLHIFAVAKEKLVSRPPESDKRNPHGRFSEIASKVLAVPKSEIDKREKEWQQQRVKKR